jgi:hypothetical protein
MEGEKARQQLGKRTSRDLINSSVAHALTLIDDM